jgi:hypothetical protein
MILNSISSIDEINMVSVQLIYVSEGIQNLVQYHFQNFPIEYWAGLFKPAFALSWR